MLEQIDGAGQGEDRAMVVGIGVLVEDAGAGAGYQIGQDFGPTTLTDVDYTGQHRKRLA
jgi:hypothetical protein